jgi:hypothetical protein
MSDWRVRQHYGYGAARIWVAADIEHASSSLGGLSGELSYLGRELRGVGWRSVLGGAPALALLLVVLAALLATLVRDPTDPLDLEVVVFELPPPEEPEPAPEPPPPPPSRVASVVAVAPPTPAPPRPTLPELPVAPALPEVVIQPEPVPEPPPRPERVPKPEIALEPAPVLAAAEVPPEPVRRLKRPPRLTRPAVALPPALVIDTPEAPVALPRAERPTVRPAARPERRVTAAMPSVAIDPLASATVPSQPVNHEVFATRTAAPRPERQTRARTAAAPRFDLAAPAALPGAVEEKASPRSRVRRAASRPAGSGARTAQPKNLALAALTSSASLATASPGKAAPTRAARVTPDRSQAARQSPADERLEGVPLSALAACMSDREEDRLKMDVLASVGGQPECRSQAGRYRFVETKNLNAFLMWIERSPSRAQTDRCIELQLALECLRGPEARRG